LELGLLKLGVLLGLGAAAPIGPVNVEIARRTLRGGFRRGFALGCGAVSIDVLYAVLSSQGFKGVLPNRTALLAMGVAGALVMLALAAMSFRSAWRSLSSDPLVATAAMPRRGSGRNAYVTGVVMTLFNPLTLAFWFVAVPGALGPITEEPAADLPMICAGVFVGTLGWVVLFAGALALAGPYYRPRWLAPAADGLGGLTLLGFALLSLWRLRDAFL
jgi:threonine/homoserine/homoserine lactone efflux protein